MSRVSSSFAKSFSPMRIKSQVERFSSSCSICIVSRYCSKTLLFFLYELAKYLSYSFFNCIYLSDYHLLYYQLSSIVLYRFIRIWNELALISSFSSGHEVANLCLLLKAFFPESEPQDRARAATQLTLNPSYLSSQMVWKARTDKQGKKRLDESCWFLAVGNMSLLDWRFRARYVELAPIRWSQLFAGSQGNVGDNISTSFSMWPSLPLPAGRASYRFLTVSILVL